MNNKAIILVATACFMLVRFGIGAEPVLFSPPGADAWYPVCSPSGSHCVFIMGNTNLWYGETVGNKGGILVSPGGTILSLAFSPSGKQILFVTESAGKKEICTVEIATGNSRRVGEGDHPCWSPDGRKIAFENRSGIMVTGTNGSEPKLAAKTQGTSVAHSPCWLAGENIFYVRDGDIVRTDSAGTAEEVVLKGVPTEHLFDEIFPSPEGNMILALLASGWNVTSIPRALVIDPAAKSEKELGDRLQIRWSADGKTLVSIIKGSVFMERPGEEKQRLTNNTLDETPFLSATGELFFSSRRKDTNGDEVIDWRDQRQVYRLKMEKTP